MAFPQRLALLILVLTFLVIVACVAAGLSYLKRKQKQQIRVMLRNAEAATVEQIQSNLMRPEEIENTLSKLLDRISVTHRLQALCDQSDSDWTPSKVVTMSFLMAGVGFLLGLRFHLIVSPKILGLAFGAFGAAIPFLILLRKRSKLVSDFEEQFPDALDFLSRSMRAGHGFSVALEMLAADSPDPVGKAFRRVANDLSLGSPMNIALGKLVTMVPIVDVQFFTSSVILQQETGGNLGEILTKLSYIIRERFRLKGQVKAVSAHGRITGLVLLLMPVGVAGFIMLTNPAYLAGLTLVPQGRMMIYGAIGGQVVGYFVIKKIIDIKV